MKKPLITLLLISTLLTPVQFLRADKNLETEGTFASQIIAIAEYIKRTLLPQRHKPLSDAELRESIQSAHTWFIKAQEESGHFRYEYVPYENEYLEGDNIVRQAGALYVLGEIARRDKEHTLITKEMAEKAIGFFENISVTDDREEYHFRCIALNGISSTCKLGATSLALSGMLGYLDAYPEERATYEPLVESYVTYILQMKKPDAGFRNIHYTDQTKQKKKESSFSNGEALLALVRYYKQNPREDVKIVIDDTFEYLKDQPFDSALYLWMMAALKDMHELWGKEEYITYGKAFTDWRITRVSRFRNTIKNYCAYTEGIVSAYNLLEKNLDKLERETLRAEISYWNNKNIKLQITEKDLYRLFNKKDGLGLAMEKLEKPTLAFGGFLTAENEQTQRIDFTQHCATTYVQTLVDINGVSL